MFTALASLRLTWAGPAALNYAYSLYPAGTLVRRFGACEKRLKAVMDVSDGFTKSEGIIPQVDAHLTVQGRGLIDERIPIDHRPVAQVAKELSISR